MSYELTPERLQSIAVDVVSQFITKQASLSDAISGKAKSLELNPEQIKRVIETSNTIAYLRQLEDTPDRSFEFPVATYPEVMGKMVLPEGTSESVTAAVTPVAVVSSAPVETVSSITDQEKVAMLRKETLRVRQTLTKMAEEGVGMSMQLEASASLLSKDPFALEKLAQVSSAEDLPLLRVLCGLTKEAETRGSVFTQNELKQAMTLNSLFKEARELVSSTKKAEAFVKQASEVLEKVSFRLISDKGSKPLIERPARKAPGVISKSVGAAVGAPVEFAGRAAGTVVRGVGKGVGAAGKAVANKAHGLMTGGGMLSKRPLLTRLGGATNVGFSALAGTSVEHANPVWDSLHN